MEALYAHYPGLVVVTPATVEDAYKMLFDAVALDDPVIFCEHKFLYNHLKAESLPETSLPIGKARLARTGRDATIVTHGAMLHESLAAATELAEEGFELEIVDLRSVKPLDTDTILASVARTGRLLCVSEEWPWGGVTSEVIARVSAEGFGLLDVAPMRVNAKDTPVPYHPDLWSVHRPTASTIAARMGGHWQSAGHGRLDGLDLSWCDGAFFIWFAFGRLLGIEAKAGGFLAGHLNVA